MSSRKLTGWGVAIAVVATGLIIGCSKKSTAPTNPITNPEYNYMVSQSNEVVDSLVGLTDLGLDMTIAATDDILKDLAFGPLPTDSSSVEDTWHIFLLTNSASGVTSSYIDSVQFSRNGNAQSNPVGANELTYVRNWSSNADDTTESYKNTEVRSTFTATGTDQSIATVNGEAQVTITDVDKSGTETVVRELTLSGTISNYMVDRSNGWNAGCPTSGTITIEASLAVTVGDAAPIASDWTVDVTFEEGKTTVTVTESGKTVSFKSNVCD